MAMRAGIRVLVNINDQLHRDFLKQIVRQQTDMKFVKFAPDGTDATAWAAVRDQCKKVGPDERVVLIASFQADEESAFLDRCGIWLVNFPGVVVIAIDWTLPKVIVLRYELRCDQVSSSLDELVNAIRHAPFAADHQPSRW